MENEKKITNTSGDQEKKGLKGSISRRSVIKGLAGLPVTGFFSYELLKKLSYDKHSHTALMNDLGLGNISAPQKLTSAVKGELIRIGMIGFGGRATALAKALGFIHPDNEKSVKAGVFDDWLIQADLNVAITGICDVFDPHAEIGLEIASSKLRPGGGTPAGYR